MKLNEDYRFRPDLAEQDEKSTLPIEILIGKYKGIVFRFTAVKLEEQAELGVANLKFGFEIMEVPYSGTETPSHAEMKKDILFQKIAGLVLNALLLENFGEIKEDE